MVSVGLVQRKVRRLRRETPHPLRAPALGQPRDGLPPAGGGEEVHARQLLMTRPGAEGGGAEEREDDEEGEETEEGQERKGETQKQQEALCVDYTWQAERSVGVD